MTSTEETIKRKSKYRLPMAFTIYELARSGVSEKDIAGTLGISHAGLQKWKQKYQSVREALEQGKAIKKANQSNGDLYDFIAGRLPEDLYDLWNELLEADDDPNAISRLEKLIELHGKSARQRLFLHALLHFNFDVGRACRFVNINRNIFLGWKTQDPDFARLIDEVTELKGDFYEHALVRMVRQGIPAAVIHANKTYNAKRGYGTKVELNVSGQINHTHSIKVSELGLPLDVRVKMLEAIREQRKEEQQKQLRVIEVQDVSK